MESAVQYLKPQPFIHQLSLSKRRRGRGRRSIVAALSLTSMVDMFSLLVIFLLQAFSTSPELLVISKGLELPRALTGQETKDAPVLTLSSEGVFLDQKKVGSLAEVSRNPTTLMKRLGELRDRWQAAHPKAPFPGEINLQAHAALPSTTIARIMAMLPSQQFASIQLVTLAGERK